MKKIILSLTIIVCALWTVSAQSVSEDSEKNIQARITYMQEHLKLNATEAKTFWTEYENFLRTEMSYHETFKKNLDSKKIKYDPRNKESIESVSSDQLTYMMDQKMELKKKLNTLESNFYKKIKGILTPRHLFDFYSVDEQYKRHMVSMKSKAATPKPAAKDLQSSPAQSKSRR